MTVFQAVKESVTTRQAAGRYGVRVGRSGMACCPFHQDKTPSMKVDRRFHCFGCGEDGDVIDFTAKLFGIPPKEAAEKLAGDFGVPYDAKGRENYRPPEKPLVSREERWRRVETRCFRALCRYYHLLGDWEREYAPKAPDEPLHPLFLEAVEKKNGLAYRLDVLRCGSLAEKAAVVAESGKEVKEIERRIAEFAGRDPAGAGRSGD